MQAKIARKAIKNQQSPPLGPDEHLTASLKSCRSILTQSLVRHWQAETSTHSIESFTLTFCKAAHFSQIELMDSTTTHYFLHRKKSTMTLAAFADELTSLGWALCFANPEQLLKYMLELRTTDSEDAGYVSVDTCSAFLEDMYTIPRLDIDARTTATTIMQELVDYATAILPACPSAVIYGSPREAQPELLEPPIDYKDVGDLTMPCDLSPLAIMIHDTLCGTRRDTFDSDDDERRTSTTQTGSYSDSNEHTYIHIDTVLRFFKLRRSKIWPLASFQTSLRAIFFGDRYWQRVTSSSEKPSVVASSDSIFTFTCALRDLYLPKEKAPPSQNSSTTKGSHSRIKDVMRKIAPKCSNVDETANGQSRNTFSKMLQHFVQHRSGN